MGAGGKIFPGDLSFHTGQVLESFSFPDSKKKNSVFPNTLLSDLEYLVSVSALMICAAQGFRWAPNFGNVPETWPSTQDPARTSP